MKAYRCICFDCKSYCIPKEGRLCNMCNGSTLARVGYAFRPPAKTRETAWKKLLKIHLAQDQRDAVLRDQRIKSLEDRLVQDAPVLKELASLKEPAKPGFMGFAGSRWGRWGSSYKSPGVPKKLKEAGYLMHITPRG